MKFLRNAVPWWIRIAAKIILARLPVPYMFWKRLRLFEHGDMNEPRQALDTFLEHAKTAGILDLNTKSASPRLIRAIGGFNVLELGPGDSLFSAVIARTIGASQSWLVDSGPFATTDMSAYTGLFDFLRQAGYPVPHRNSVPRTLADVLRGCNGQYLTEGVQSLAVIPSASVDFCFSNAVLEHIPKREFSKLTDELMRILKPGGVSVHRVDLKDHLGGGLNNLRFSEATWENSLFRNSGFYTNRIRFCEMVALFKKSGFDCHVSKLVRWETLPISLSMLDDSFRQLDNSDLLVSGFDIVLKPKDQHIVNS